MTQQQLRNSILQQAIEGKLVEQRKEEGTAEELYSQIQEEKKKLIAEGKIKKEKPLPEITEDEIPFDIPESWLWVKLGNISSYAQKKEKVTASSIEQDQWCLDLEHIEKETGKILEIKKAKDCPIKGDKNCFKKGDILYSKLRPYLKKILVAPDKGICSSEIVPFNTYYGIDNCYFVYVLKSAYIDCIVNSDSYGVKMPRVGTDTMTNLLIPLPPLAEQKRIVAKIEELLPFVDKYEKAYNALEEYNARFPEDMRKSILQQAIEGKLVEQRKEEGTAEELYSQIQEEKQKLIADGIIKKEKPLPKITEEEIPFDIPESWKWVRLNHISEIIGDGLHGTPQYDATGDYFFINGNNLVEGKIEIKNDTKRVNRTEFLKHEKKLNNQTILLSINGTLGNLAFYNGEKVILGKSAGYTTLTSYIFKEYIYYFFLSNYFLKYATQEATQTTIKNVSLKAMRMVPIPLPPLAEQKRIVAKIEELLPYCDMLNQI